MFIHLSKNKLYNIFPKALIISICWLIILFSINTLFRDFVNIKNLKISLSLENFFLLTNFLRYISPLILLILFLIIKKYNFNIFSKILIIYGLTQIVSLILFRDIEAFFNTISYPLLLFTLVMFFEIFKNDFKESIFSLIFSITIFFLVLIVLILLPELITNYFTTPGQKYLYWASDKFIGGKIFLQAYPRVTGVSRSLLIILFFLISFYLFGKSNKYKKLIFLCVIIVSTLIYSIQSRGALIGYIPMLIIIIFFLNLETKVKIYTLVGIVLLPILIWEGLSFTKNSLITKTKSDYLNLYTKPNSNAEELKLRKKRHESRIFSTKVYNSSGRVEIWKKSFEIIKKKKIYLGYGPQADRYLIPTDEIFFYEGKKSFLSSNSSNGYIYAYLCAGIIGVICILIFSLIIFIKLIKILFFDYDNIQDPKLIFSIFSLSYFLLRILIENSFALFSTDLCIVILCLTYLFKRKIKNKE
jgi:hypothetical protein